MAFVKYGLGSVIAELTATHVVEKVRLRSPLYKYLHMHNAWTLKYKHYMVVARRNMNDNPVIRVLLILLTTIAEDNFYFAIGVALKQRQKAKRKKINYKV